MKTYQFINIFEALSTLKDKVFSNGDDASFKIAMMLDDAKEKRLSYNKAILSIYDKYVVKDESKSDEGKFIPKKNKEGKVIFKGEFTEKDLNNSIEKINNSNMNYNFIYKINKNSLLNLKDFNKPDIFIQLKDVIEKESLPNVSNIEEAEEIK